MTKIVGNHSFKVGFEFKHNRNLDDGFFTGDMTFDKVPTEDPQNAAATGNAVASYLLGLPTIARRNIGAGTTALMRKEDYSFYFQDDWRGHAQSNRQSRACAMTSSNGRSTAMTCWPQSISARVNFSGMERTPSRSEGPNVRRGIIEPDNNNFAPRVGLAYRLGDKSTNSRRLRRFLHVQLPLGGARRSRELALCD